MASGENLSPEFFGPKSSLYGCYHLAAAGSQAPATVICQPTGHEYERCHRAMRQLARLLSRKGVATLRFDYFATGDSAGDSEALELSRMAEDIAEALNACRRKTGAERLALIGIRLGATLAAQTALADERIDSLVLFAPVFDGSVLLQEWQEQQRLYDAKFSWTPEKREAGEILGFPVTESFREQISRRFAPEPANASLRRVLLLTAEAGAGAEVPADWLAALERHGAAVTVEAMPDPPVWQREPMDALVPAKTLRRIVAWLTDD